MFVPVLSGELVFDWVHSSVVFEGLALYGCVCIYLPVFTVVNGGVCIGHNYFVEDGFEF